MIKRLSGKSICKITAVSMLLLMAFSITACKSNVSTNNETTGAITTVPVTKAEDGSNDPLAKYDPPVKLKVTFVSSPGHKFLEGDSFENNEWTRAYKDILGIDLEFLWIMPTDQAEQKMNVSIASGDLPDLIDAKPLQFKKLLEEDLLEDLTDIYDSSTTEFTKSVLNSDGGISLNTAKQDGKLMAIPNVSFLAERTSNAWIRADWLQKLNLQMPTNFNEFISVAESFVTGDPDGNGQNDTVAFALQKGLHGSVGNIDPLFWSFHAYPSKPDIWLKDASGNIVNGNIQPETRKALAYIQDLYKRGFIHKEFGVMDSNKMIELINSGKAGIVFGQWWLPSWPLNQSVEKDPTVNWMPLQIFSEDDKPVQYATSVSIDKYYGIRKGYEHPEVVGKMMSLFQEKVSGPNNEFTKYGKNEDGFEFWTHSLVNAFVSDENMGYVVQLRDALKAKDPSKLPVNLKSYYDSVVKYMDTKDPMSWRNYMMYGPESPLNLLEAVKEQDGLLINIFYGTPTETMSAKQATLEKMKLETFTRIIMGSAGIEEFDKFVEDWKKLGGDEITKEVNEWYKERSN